MPLNAVDFIPLTGQIKAADIKQFFDLFTGAMTDQPVTFANTLMVGGSQVVGSAPVRINGVAAQTANMVEVRKLAADVQPEFSIGPTGTLAWGPGGAVGTDVTLARSAANQLTLTGLAGTPAIVIPVGGLQVTAGNVGIGGAPQTYLGAQITGAILTVASGGVERGLSVNATADSSATTEGNAVGAQVVTAASAFTMTTAADFHAFNPSKGANSIITNAYGLLVDAMSAGSTSNTGVRVNGPAGGVGNWAISTSGDSVFGNGTVMGNADTSGFLFISGGGGGATGVPVNNAAGFAMRFNSSVSQLQIYNAGWKSVTLA